MKRDLRFPLSLEDDPDGGVLATFADVPEAIAHGRDRKDAINWARRALAIALFGYLKHGRSIPLAKTSASGEAVGPLPIDVLKVTVVESWRRSTMTKSEFGRLLGVDEKEARCILDPDCAAKAGRLEQALSVLGCKVNIAVAAA